jgi:hypothetical protein
VKCIREIAKPHFKNVKEAEETSGGARRFYEDEIHPAVHIYKGSCGVLSSRATPCRI